MTGVALYQGVADHIVVDEPGAGYYGSGEACRQARYFVRGVRRYLNHGGRPRRGTVRFYEDEPGGQVYARCTYKMAGTTVAVRCRSRYSPHRIRFRLVYH
jgi:hypothetical protein